MASHFQYFKDASSIQPFLRGSYDKISLYKRGNIVLRRSTMKELRSNVSFTQLRFFCRGTKSLSIIPLTNGVTTLRTMKSSCMITWFSSGTNNIGCFHQKVRDSNAMILTAMFPQVIFGRYMCVEDSIEKIIIFAAHTKIAIYIKYFFEWNWVEFNSVWNHTSDNNIVLTLHDRLFLI